MNNITGYANESDSSLSTGKVYKRHVRQQYEVNASLKRYIWVYFFLVIFEGALRKWFLPGLATPLLVIRDPIAIWIIYSAWNQNLFPKSFYLSAVIIIGVIGIYTAFFLGHGNLLVALFGARTLLLHYPMIFVIGMIFNREDVLKMGKVTLFISIPMAFLLAVQFYSPQSAWVNRGIGGDVTGAGFSGSGEFLRAPTTFSFTNGTTLFFGFVAAFVFYFWLQTKEINKKLLVAASVALLASIPLSISRSLFFDVLITLIFTIFASFRKPELIGKMVVAVVIGFFTIVVLSQTSFFKTATGAFTERFTSANEQEGGLVKGVLGDRFLGGLVSALTGASDQPFWGFGLGMGTNVGSMLLTGGQTFLISEGEWGRIIGELGAVMGLVIVILRIGLTAKVAAACYKRMILGDVLPWLLLSFGFIILAQGSWSQPTSLGFFVLIGGLLFASLSDRDQKLSEVNS